MEDHNIDEVIFNNLSGEPTTNDIEVLRKWLSESDGNKVTFNLMKDYWEKSRLEIASPDLEKAYLRLKSNSVFNHKDQIDNNPNNTKKNFIWYKVAAVFVFFLTFGGLLYYLHSTNDSAISEAGVHEIIKENPKGQKLTTYLPDGSKVILNSQSKIKYNSPFPFDQRQIVLEGEAFFEVKKNPDAPFTVIANGISTTALGTSFNINSKKPDNVEVMLLSGKVRVSYDEDNSVVLSPGRAAIVNRQGEFRVEEFDYETKVGWKDGILVFKDDSLPDILKKLEDWYGVEFLINEDLGSTHSYSGRYQNESLEEVLRGIAFVHKFTYKTQGDTIRIYKNKK
jgi:ferric-dicitrate binding protein FerR (iron transport regulator)